ncbi:cell wall protein SED1-like [Miscanthus floridulus]|uniref:cell wall protein SED1-like n=1 Tax=Miscanthus floridulus TaxID=154761 RepID=UPI003457E872
MSSSIRPASSAAAWAVGGADCATPSDATMAASDPAGLVMVTGTSIWASGGTDCAAPSDTTVAAFDSARPASGAITWAAGGTDCATPSDTTTTASDCSWLGAVMDAYSATTEGTGTTAGAARPGNEATTPSPLLPETGATLGSTIRPA